MLLECKLQQPTNVHRLVCVTLLAVHLAVHLRLVLLYLLPVLLPLSAAARGTQMTVCFCVTMAHMETHRQRAHNVEWWVITIRYTRRAPTPAPLPAPPFPRL